MEVEFRSTSFAAPEPPNMNLLVELMGNYPPMPLVTQKTVRSFPPETPRATSPSCASSNPRLLCSGARPPPPLGFARRHPHRRPPSIPAAGCPSPARPPSPAERRRPPAAGGRGATPRRATARPLARRQRGGPAPPRSTPTARRQRVKWTTLP